MATCARCLTLCGHEPTVKEVRSASAFFGACAGSESYVVAELVRVQPLRLILELQANSATRAPPWLHREVNESMSRYLPIVLGVLVIVGLTIPQIVMSDRFANTNISAAQQAELLQEGAEEDRRLDRRGYANRQKRARRGRSRRRHFA